MSLKGYWRFATAPSFFVGKSVASLRSCFPATSSARSLLTLSTPLHHASFVCLFLGRRGLCWVRRTPPFPRSAGPKASCVQVSAEKTISDLSTLEGGVARKSHLRSADASVSSGRVIVASWSPSLSDSSEAVCSIDINDDFPVVTDCIETATTEDNDIAQQSLIGLSAPTGPAINASDLVDSSANSANLFDAPHEDQIFLTSAKEGKLGFKLSRGPQLRRMLKSNHAAVRDCKDETAQWFPYIDQFKVKDKVLTSAQIMQMLGPYMLEDRKERIKRVVANRTYTICTVVEGLLDLGNIAAIFRTADALGFQSVQVISNETERRYKKNRRISLGSEKWLDAEIFKVTKDCFKELRARGYRVAVASVADDSVPITDMDWTIPTAIVFGNEHRGVSTEALQWADLSCHIPMEGMVDSFNVSVAAGIVMHHAVNDRKARLGRHGDLSEEEQRILSADFYLRHNFRSLSVIEQLLQLNQEERQDKKSALRGDMELDIELPEQLKVDLERVCAELYPA